MFILKAYMGRTQREYGIRNGLEDAAGVDAGGQHRVKECGPIYIADDDDDDGNNKPVLHNRGRVPRRAHARRARPGSGTGRTARF
jgi:hypothetical protein